jgi:branched-chain amino acid transport system permease protein
MTKLKQFFQRFPSGTRLLTVTLWTAIAILVSTPLSPSNATLLAGGAAASVVVLGLTWLTGWSGQISIGNSGFMAVGGYAFGIWATHHASFPFAATLAIATLAGALSGLVLGIPATRLRGPYLAGVTLAFAYTLPQLVLNFSSWTGGSGGLNLQMLTPPTWFANMYPGPLGFLSADTHWLTDIVVLVAGIAFYFMSNLFHSRTGRAMRLVRDNDVAAELVGINLPRARTMAFVIAAAYGGLGGGLTAQINHVINPNTYPVTLSIVLLTVMVLGGIGTLSGAVIAGVIYAFSNVIVAHLNSALGISDTSNLGIYMQQILFGGLLIATMLLAPRGLVGVGQPIRKLGRKLRRKSPVAA